MSSRYRGSECPRHNQAVLSTGVPSSGEVSHVGFFWPHFMIALQYQYYDKLSNGKYASHL